MRILDEGARDDEIDCIDALRRVRVQGDGGEFEELRAAWPEEERAVAGRCRRLEMKPLEKMRGAGGFKGHADEAMGAGGCGLRRPCRHGMS